MRADCQADDEGNELVQETAISEETGFDRERGDPWAIASDHGNTLMRYIDGQDKGLWVIQAGWCRGIGIHGILIIENY